MAALIAATVFTAPVFAQGLDAAKPAPTASAAVPNVKGSPTLKVCADPNSLPQSNQAGAGYENKLAEALARDLGKKLEYTYFPQRMGFVRNTLRARNDGTQDFKCDVIMGVPKGYELTATTQSYMRSTYALVVPAKEEFKNLATAEDLLKLPKERLQALHFGIFAQTPATDWLLRNGLIEHARLYAAQSGDPSEHPANIIERDLSAGNIDVAAVWGPVAGFIVNQHQGPGEKQWLTVPFKPDPQIRFDYEIAMGVRFGEKEWKDTLDTWINTHRPDIEKILVGYHVPLLDIAPATAIN
ncbi:MAG: quinoprotein dehydrogenase-associated putative ABC transporter substrate-binding protein [Gammaproteobacteria bacterium]